MWVIIFLVVVCGGVGFWVWRVTHSGVSYVQISGRPWLAAYLPQLYEPLSGANWGACDKALFTDDFTQGLNSRYISMGDVQVKDGMLMQTPSTSKLRTKSASENLVFTTTRGRVSGNFVADMVFDDSKLAILADGQGYGMGLYVGQNMENMYVIQIEGSLTSNASTSDRMMSTYQLVNNQAQDRQKFKLPSGKATEFMIVRAGKKLFYYVTIDGMSIPINVMENVTDSSMMMGIMTHASPQVDGYGQFDQLSLRCQL